VKLALRELRRRPNRFAVATVILTLIALLLTFLGGLLDGLERGSTGALRLQDADAIVFADGADGSLVRSRIGEDVRQQVAAVVGADRVGGLGSVQLGGRLEDRGPRDLVPTVLFGYELAPTGLPEEPPAAGEVFADESLRSEGVDAGTILRLGPARSEVRVIGFVDDSQYAGQGSLWGSLDTWREVLAANRPGARAGEGTVQALVVRAPAEGGGELTRAIDEATGGATESYTIAGAIEALPGVSQQRSVFNQIIGVTIVIAIVVVALFFALLTVERMGLYGVLKALGASSGTIFAGVLLQAVVVTAVACTVGIAAAVGLDALIPAGSIPFAVTPPRLVTSAVSLLVAALVGCAFSLRRVLRVDPAAAIGGAQ
jgi:putative ABC transport system permease protein